MPYRVNDNVFIYTKDEAGLALIASYSGGAVPTTASTFALGCELTNLSNGVVFRNLGTVAVPVWELNVGSTSDSRTIASVSNGTTEVSVFGATGLPYAITITGVYLIARDTTATNVTVEAPASTVVCTIAKGTVSGVLVGAATLANTAVPASTNVILDGSGAGVAQVFITYRRT